MAFYTAHSLLVEVDSTFYTLPSERMVSLRAELPLEGFTCDVKAFASGTGHPEPVRPPPPAVRDALPNKQRERGWLYLEDLPPEGQDLL